MPCICDVRLSKTEWVFLLIPSVFCLVFFLTFLISVVLQPTTYIWSSYLCSGCFLHGLLFLVSRNVHVRLFNRPGCYLANVVTVFSFSNYVLRVFTYVLKEKYWLDGSNITIFSYRLLFRQYCYLLLVWWSLVCVWLDDVVMFCLMSQLLTLSVS